METIYFSLNNMPVKNEGLSLALGNFDGVHRGHQRLFVETSLNSSRDAAALFFDEPFLSGPYLSSLDDKLRHALSSRLDALYVLQDAKSIYSLTPEEFIEKILLPLGTRRVVVGEDFRFGRGGVGDADTLRRYFDVDVVPLLLENGEKVSSTAAKHYLSLGDIEKTTSLLGRPYEISGVVGEGFHNGAKIGYPTANIHSDFPYVLPRPGVYAGVIYLSGKAYRAMINVGLNPTVGALSKPLVEVHVLDYEEDCYGKKAYVGFLAYVREEKKFASLDELGKQLREDERRIRDILA